MTDPRTDPLSLSEEEFEQWFVGRYGHHTRDWHDDRGLPRRREAIQALIDRATAALHRLDHPSEQAHAATERGSYYARDTLAGSTDE